MFILSILVCNDYSPIFKALYSFVLFSISFIQSEKEKVDVWEGHLSGCMMEYNNNRWKYQN